MREKIEKAKRKYCVSFKRTSISMSNLIMIIPVAIICFLLNHQMLTFFWCNSVCYNVFYWWWLLYIWRIMRDCGSFFFSILKPSFSSSSGLNRLSVTRPVSLRDTSRILFRPVQTLSEPVIWAAAPWAQPSFNTHTKAQWVCSEALHKAHDKKKSLCLVVYLTPLR